MTERRRLRAALAVLLVAGLAASPGSAAGAESAASEGAGVLFRDAPAAGNGGPIAPGLVIRSRAVAADPATLRALSAGGPVTLNLFEGRTYQAAGAVVTRHGPGRFTWSGRLVGDPDSRVILVVSAERVTGTVGGRDGSFAVRPLGERGLIVYELDRSAFPEEADPVLPPDGEPDGSDQEVAVAPDERADSPDEIDLLVAYTAAARSQLGGTSQINDLIELAVEETNLAYANSAVNQRLVLVHTAETVYEESGDSSVDLGRLHDPEDGYMDEVHALRDEHRADVVSLFAATLGTGVCGIGYVMGPDWVSTDFAPHAFSVVDVDCAAGNLTLAHELGHNMGAQHEVGQANTPPAFDWSYGYVDDGYFRTLMAYGTGCSYCPRIAHFSNPAVTYEGRPTGVWESPDFTDNAATLDATAEFVANFRVRAEPATTGMLRVTTSPAVMSQILVDEMPRDTWGLTWVKLPPGEYTVSFADVPGFTTPGAQMVSVTEGQTTEWAGLFEPRGYLRVVTDPAVPSTIFVDGTPRNDWGMWTDLPPGDYEVCFGEVPGYLTPACQTAAVTAGTTTPITGAFTPSGGGSSAVSILGDPEPRIVGGTEVSPEGKYPFMVTVYPGPYICGGALVSDSWVLTAAHCTEGIAADDIEVVVGRHDRRDTDEGEVIGVTAKFEHPDYGAPSQWSNDFSLLALASPTTLGSPIGLAGPDEVDLYPAGTMATVAGWGDTSWQGDLSWVLLEVDVPIVSDTDCAAVYESDFDGPTMVCAGYEEGGKDPCQGDSGGPLFLDTDGAYLHIGVVSFGYQCAVPGYPGVFAETSSAYEWIASTAGLGDGMLRVTTSPAVPSQILIDGIPRDTWGLTWMKLPPGDYQVSFTDLPGFDTPPARTVTVNAGETTETAGLFVERGWLRVDTSPPVPATIVVDGVPRNDWGMWTDLPPGDYEVCFGEAEGYAPPGCQTATVTAGELTTITGNYSG